LPSSAVPADEPGTVVEANARNPTREDVGARGRLPNDTAAIKLLGRARRTVPARTVRAAFDWKSAMSGVAVLFGERSAQARG
jgi:putative transposase